MLAIRLQRTGRTGHAQYRLIAQDSRYSPTSGRVVAFLGNYDPHTKAIQIDKETVAKLLSNGAQPSPRAASLLKAEGVKLPNWVAEPVKKKSQIRNQEKLRKNRPAGAEPTAEATQAKPADDTPAEETPVAEAEAPAEETSKEEPTEEVAKSSADETTESATEEPGDETPAKTETTEEEPSSVPADEAVEPEPQKN